jgi:hypothetical protein
MWHVVLFSEFFNFQYSSCTYLVCIQWRNHGCT